MDALIQQLVDELGLDEAAAKQAITIVLSMVKDKIPAPLAGQLENLLDGGELDEQAGGGIMDVIGGLFGKK